MLERITALIRGLERKDTYSRALQAARLRAAYQRASEGPAEQLAPDQLHAAETFLATAEKLRAKLADPKISSLCKTDGLGFRIREIVTGIEKVLAD